MNYRGRLTLVFLSILSMIISWVSEVSINPLFVIFSIFHITCSWVIGGVLDKYRFYSYYDPLTGVYNRRYADHIFETKIKRAMKQNKNVGVLTLDINQFKTINDTLGHECGDFLLKEVCCFVQETMGKEDILIRWGGDEFLVLLVNKDKRYVKQLSEQIKLRNEELYNSSSEENKLFPTLAIGYSIFPEDANTLSELIAIADQRMYEVKPKK